MSTSMVISEDIKGVRAQLAVDISEMYEIIGEYFPTANIGSLNAAISKLKNGRPINCPYKELSPTNWGYKVSKLIFPLEDNVPRKMKPNDAVDLKLVVNMHVVGDCDLIDTMNDPLLWLAMDFKIEGEIIKNDKVVSVFTCYHLDRHIENNKTLEKDEESEEHQDNEPHPFYHFQFGGRHLVNEIGELDTGDLIVLETPRITHHPMDLILGLDYLISYFFPQTRKEILKKSREYAILLRKYQEIILKPYFHTLSSHWLYDSNSIALNPKWNPISICPQIIK